MRTGCNRTIVQIVHERQYKWLGHVLRMNQTRIAPTVLQGKVDGVRRAGKPRATWANLAVERAQLSLHKTIGRAQDRLNWRELGRVVGAHVTT